MGLLNKVYGMENTGFPSVSEEWEMYVCESRGNVDVDSGSVIWRWHKHTGKKFWRMLKI